MNATNGMARQRNIFLIALIASLLIHFGGAGAYVGWAHFHPSGKRDLAPAAPELIVRLDDLGSATGTGIGSNSSPGEEPLQAREADEDQALLSRDPVGVGRIGGPPAKYTGPVGDGAGGAPAVAESPPAPQQQLHAPAEPVKESPPPAPPVQVASSLPLPREPEAPSQKERPPTPEEKPAIARPEPPVAKAVQAVAEAKPQAATGDGRTPGLPQPAADPLPQSESDSDPFARISANLKFRNGKLVERWGRLVKTTRPQINVAGQIDLLALNGPTVVLEVHIDKTGKVTDVKVAHSSGSNQIDEPTRLAVYDWWFEPAKDKSGKPVNDIIFFTVEFI